MSWDRTRPQGSEKIRNSDDLLRENNQALEDALSEGHEFETGGDQSGKHVSPTFKDVGSDPDQPTKSNELRLYNKSAVLYTLDEAGKSRGVNKNTDIPEGTKMLFKQDSAPSGWTFKSEDNDRVLINADTEDQGGSTGGDWKLSGISVDNHELTKNELPEVSGSFYIRKSGDYNAVTNTTGQFSFDDGAGSSENDLGAPGEGTADTDEVKFSFGSGDGHNHGVSTNDEWRPKYVSVITCEKD